MHMQTFVEFCGDEEHAQLADVQSSRLTEAFELVSNMSKHQAQRTMHRHKHKRDRLRVNATVASVASRTASLSDI